MKNYPVFIRALAALACALGLASCGGNGGYVSLTGSISGLTTSGLILYDASSLLSISSGATSFIFPTKVLSNYSYSVTVYSQPTDSTCTITNGSGIAGTDDVSDIKVTCVATSFKLGGTITGLTGSGLEIVNGSNDLTIAAQTDPTKTDSWVFSTKVAENSHYGVTILNQPTGQTCTIANALGTMPAADNLTAIAITCT